MKKKLLAALLATAMTVTMFAGCGTLHLCDADT